MNEQYTPTTENVKDVWVDRHQFQSFWMNDSNEDADAFDRMIEQVHRKAKAEGWDEALELLENNSTIDLETLEYYKQANLYRDDQEGHDD